jgi:hypothetical protein
VKVRQIEIKALRKVKRLLKRQGFRIEAFQAAMFESSQATALPKEVHQPL